MTEPVETKQGLILPGGKLIAPRLAVDEGGYQHFPELLTRYEWRQLHAVLRAQYFLFRNDGGQYGERGECKGKNPDGSARGCGLKHMYFTYMCVERPFRGGNGLEEGLWLSFRASRDDVRKRQILRTISRLPDLAEGHPFTARDLAPSDPGENWLAVLLSLPEPIEKGAVDKRGTAMYYASKINYLNPPIKYCLLERCTEFMTPSPACELGAHHFGSPV